MVKSMVSLDLADQDLQEHLNNEAEICPPEKGCSLKLDEIEDFVKFSGTRTAP